MEAVTAIIRYPMDQIPKKGTKESSDDLVCWLQAIHVAHVWANEVYDLEAYKFFFMWYCALSE
jgi:hypothetical protein